ncbi:hypothetical protein B5S31_g2949 [[Candida] boidinii]|nr:hypothetical protein B5S31_g2949 [[Candida] boidinii]
MFRNSISQYTKLYTKSVVSNYRQFSSSVIVSNSSSNNNNKQELEKELEKLVDIKLGNTGEISEETSNRLKLLETLSNYKPRTTTDEIEVRDSSRPIPINTELNYYAPFKHEVKYGDLKAEVTFRCFDDRNLDFFCDFALRAAYYLGMPTTGPKPLPTRRERWTVNRAPFVNAKSKENFERRTHSRLIKVWDSNSEVVDLWLGFLKKNSVWGVGVKAHLYSDEPLQVSKLMDSLPESGKVLSDMAATLESLNKESQSPVAQRVIELLEDPLFAKHLSASELEQVKNNAKK